MRVDATGVGGVRKVFVVAVDITDMTARCTHAGIKWMMYSFLVSQKAP